MPCSSGKIEILSSFTKLVCCLACLLNTLAAISIKNMHVTTQISSLSFLVYWQTVMRTNQTPFYFRLILQCNELENFSNMNENFILWLILDSALLFTILTRPNKTYGQLRITLICCSPKSYADISFLRLCICPCLYALSPSPTSWCVAAFSGFDLFCLFCMLVSSVKTRLYNSFVSVFLSAILTDGKNALFFCIY